MNIENFIAFYQLMNTNNLNIWIDGGWAVDALLGEQTRPHDDIDIAIEQKNIPVLRALLEDHGYSDLPRDDTSAWNFVLADQQGRQIDVHVLNWIKMEMDYMAQRKKA